MPNIEIINANTTDAEQACHGKSSTGLVNPGPQIPQRETNCGAGTRVCHLVDSASGSACFQLPRTQNGRGQRPRLQLLGPSLRRPSTAREFIKGMLNMSELHSFGQGRAGSCTLMNEGK